MMNWQHDRRGRKGLLRRSILKGVVALGVATLLMASYAGPASAQSLIDKIKSGETIRIGFSNEMPWAYPGQNGEPFGFVNKMAIDLLKKLGATKIEPVVTDWGSLVPGLQAGRFDIITGGMFITPERCRNVLFSEPLGKFGGALLVAKGNPENLHSYEDVRDKGLVFTAASGWLAIKAAKDIGIPDDKIMEVAGTTEVVQAVKVGRAAAAGGDYLTLTKYIDENSAVELAHPFQDPLPLGYPALAFLPDQQDTVDAFNAALKEYAGSAQMMEAVSKYGYTEKQLPQGGKTTAELCRG
ncbi:ectoine/hydroxyectoine ABC transporter substrate-binding protein EhuB [Mesorhizobium sp.]|uniref:ectoine/hydroxyectoine ABC transporter substrate-binding protein EhuB n=1 Tax=Mesorhizobium sp. TaxID=1871066 RepID=UPI001227FABC|nr:ectoine/hydroxyectoine ABC transporter substrate-binding protein EhuB [Mesorhizobium sp.]TIL44450.1 MAG: ectoine/hydroxyectoine ABC transporter substrate-binding protein EhuB [Mesorhizobium sp.]